MAVSVSTPRISAIEFPLGRTFGSPGDAAGQLTVLRAALNALETIDTPGQTIHLPFEWKETEGKSPSVEPPPIVKHLMRHPRQVLNLLNRKVPQ